MAQLIGTDEIESLRIELAEIGRSMRLSYQHRTLSQRHATSFRSMSSMNSRRERDDVNDERSLQWESIERLPTVKRLRQSLYTFDGDGNDPSGKRVIDVRKLGPLERHVFIERLIKHIEKDNLQLLQKLRRRLDKVGMKLPTVDVRYKNLSIEAKCEVVKGKPLPTLWNSVKGMVSGYSRLLGAKSQEATIRIIKDVSGIIKPGRITLLLGPPSCGKTTLLLALSGKLDPSMKVTGEISYNGYRLEEFVPQKTSAYISQHDIHIPEMTVRETLDFSACCQGVGSRADVMMEVIRREKQAGIIPDPDVDTYMKAISVEGLGRSVQTDYILKILGMDICADTMVGDALRRGVSGGQKKRLTTGEMIVGPTKALFMDEISNGLDSSTTFQVVSYLQQLVHITDATALVSLLQPAPETYDLFDDIILMAEGKIVYHGPRGQVLPFFEDCGFKCPERKGAADFLQEVISRKDQGQYWYLQQPYTYVSVDQLSKKFEGSRIGKNLRNELAEPYDKSLSHKDALSFSMYSLTKWELFKQCLKREYLLMKRNSFVYVFKSIQLLIIASVAMTVFLRTRMKVDMLHANYYLGSLFFALVILLVDGFPEVSMTVARLPVFYKQRDLCFFPAWAYAIPSAVLKVPLSLVEAIVWTALTYYVIGYSPEFGRFIRHTLLLFALHLMSTSMFRFLASVFQTAVSATTAGGLSLMFLLLFGGFIIPKPSLPSWLQWGFWVSPLAYGEIGITANEFRAPRWNTMQATNITMGEETLQTRGLSFGPNFYWISLAALFGFSVLFNIGFTVALSILKPPGRSRAIISRERLSQLREMEDLSHNNHVKKKPSKAPLQIVKGSRKGGMVLPFEPLTLAFQDVQYYVDTPLEMRERGFAHDKLQLLHDITGAFKPGVLTALMGVSGAGKTTLMDVLSGRKTGGIIEGDVRVGGYPKVQSTFARISGYCEQNDIHSPQITVEESLIYSAWLRLEPTIDSKTKLAFVNEVLETIELDGIKDLLVGLPGFSGLSTEQRKRLTIAVELVANPSIVFMDEPTSGLDARAAAIVMRAVSNVVKTGRTVVCTIHQPSIDIFESFDELVLMKSGGRIIYAGPLGEHSSRVIKYFEGIIGVQKIKDNYNPATWMLEVTSASAEVELGVDFAHLYTQSSLFRENKEVVRQLSSPPPDSKNLKFPTRFPQNGWGQFKACLWKQHLSYWRNPAFNLTRIVHKIALSVLYGLVFWKQGDKIKNQQDLFNIFGFMFSATIFFGINNCSAVLPFVSTERNVLYREQFAGMYTSWAYSLAQVVIELPYSFVQTLLFVIITYPMMGFIWSAYKVFWFFYAMFCTLLYYHYLGILLVALTPNVQVATILASSFFTILNLFSGFPIPEPQIPRWWVWLYYLTPTSWTLNGMFTSQYGDVDQEIEVFGERGTIAGFLKDYFGFNHDHLGIVAVLLLAFPVIFAVMFAYCIGKLSFQRR